ncbi:C-C motif chemokine 27 [Rana temporaria]|uniref:C-C motif chemokine 27 n=1 Tax=Rana temporaria TaxID=8407 RepID=UPI001AADBA9B|nr:C-C motif chemokine 27 [Rana temporaria]
MSPLKLLALVALGMVIISALCQGMPIRTVSCCTKLAKHIPKNLLKNVMKVRFQKRDGLCNLRAIVLYVGRQQKCVDPNNKALIGWIKKARPAKYS